MKPRLNDAQAAPGDEKELANLTLAVAAISPWNRLSIAARLTTGGYRPAQAGA